MTGTLEHEEEILSFIPGLKKEKDAEGKVFYAYQGVKLSDMDRKELDKLFNKVQQEAVRIRTEKLNRQLESIRQAEQATRAAQQAARTATPPPQPPKAPAPPPATPQIPKTPPPPPPAPPRR